MNAIIKAIKIALLYWLQQALRLFCPHSNNADSRSYHAPVCPACAIHHRTRIRLELLCGWKAVSDLRKCNLCGSLLSNAERDFHSACAEREQFLAEAGR